MKGMPDSFAAALLDPALPAPGGLQDGTGREAGQRFDIYRNNVAHSLTEALRTGFPVVAKLIGRQNMTGLAGQFLRAHPPSDPILMFYGAGFPEFLAGTKALAHLGYLPDIARLELALRQAYHARDAEPMAPLRLDELPTGALMRATLAFAPAVQLLRSAWPIHDIWRFHTGDATDEPQPGAQDVLVTRPEFDPVPRLLPGGGGIWIEALMRGQSIGAAYDTALGRHPGFDMAAPLALLLDAGALVSLNAEG